jgi:hypothetical protein
VEHADNPAADTIQTSPQFKIRWLAGIRWDEKLLYHFCIQKSLDLVF